LISNNEYKKNGKVDREMIKITLPSVFPILEGNAAKIINADTKTHK